MKKALLQFRKPALIIGAFVLCIFLPTHIASADGAETAVTTAISFAGGIIGVVVAPIALFVLKITSLINLLAGTFLNSVIKYTVVDMATNYSGVTAIASTWTVMRDIANMAFIFVLLYASIQKILGKGDINRLIVNMVIAALLINFSLFFTKIVIDASNLIALTFYQSLAPGSATGDVMSAGLSNSLMQPLHLQTLWAADKVDLRDFKTLATIGIMGSLLLLIATFIFVAVALLFVIRYVVLILVLIMSPVFFLASILPSMSSAKKQWVSALSGQALFAPLYMLLTWITIKVFSSMPLTSGDQLKNLSEAIAGTVTTTGTGSSVQYQAGSINVFLNFAIVIAFLIISIVVAKSTSDSSGKGMSKITGKAFGFAGGATFGLAGRFGRGTIGRFGQTMADDKDLQARALRGDRGARLKLATAQKMSTSSFDGRGIGALGQLNAGKAQTGGFTKDKKDRDDDLKKRAKALESSGGEKAAYDARVKAAKENEEKVRTQYNNVKTQATKDSETVVPKSDEHIVAEKAEEEAKEKLNGPFKIGEDRNSARATYEKAKVEAEKHRVDREEKMQEHIKTTTLDKELETELAKSAKEAAEKSDPGQVRAEVAAQGREEKMKAQNTGWKRWVPTSDRVLLFGNLKREETEAPGMIRSSVKSKSKKDIAAEANLAALKETEEEEKKAKGPDVAASEEKPASSEDKK